MKIAVGLTHWTIKQEATSEQFWFYFVLIPTYTALSQSDQLKCARSLQGSHAIFPHQYGSGCLILVGGGWYGQILLVTWKKYNPPSCIQKKSPRRANNFFLPLPPPELIFSIPKFNIYENSLLTLKKLNTPFRVWTPCSNPSSQIRPPPTTN